MGWIKDLEKKCLTMQALLERQPHDVSYKKSNLRNDGSLRNGSESKRGIPEYGEPQKKWHQETFSTAESEELDVIFSLIRALPDEEKKKMDKMSSKNFKKAFEKIYCYRMMLGDEGLKLPEKERGEQYLKAVKEERENIGDLEQEAVALSSFIKNIDKRLVVLKSTAVDAKQSQQAKESPQSLGGMTMHDSDFKPKRLLLDERSPFCWKDLPTELQSCHTDYFEPFKEQISRGSFSHMNLEKTAQLLKGLVAIINHNRKAFDDPDFMEMITMGLALTVDQKSEALQVQLGGMYRATFEKPPSHHSLPGGPPIGTARGTQSRDGPEAAC